MAKLDIGIGEDFPVEEKKTQSEECPSRRHRHGHHPRHAHRERWHQWMRERFSRPERKDAE